MTLQEFRNLLLSILPGKVFHNGAYQAKGEYLVWRDMSKNSLRADGATAESAHIIALDYFSGIEFDPFPDLLEKALEENEIACGDVEKIFDPETTETHYAWTAEVV